MAHHRQAQGAQEPHADLPAVPLAGAEPSREHLAVTAFELALQQRLRRLQRHHRCRVQRLDPADGTAAENHLNRDEKVGTHRSQQMTLGISRSRAIILYPVGDPYRLYNSTHSARPTSL